MFQEVEFWKALLDIPIAGVTSKCHLCQLLKTERSFHIWARRHHDGSRALDQFCSPGAASGIFPRLSNVQSVGRSFDPSGAGTSRRGSKFIERVLMFLTRSPKLSIRSILILSHSHGLELFSVFCAFRSSGSLQNSFTPHLMIWPWEREES